MKSFKEYLMENRSASFWKSVSFKGLKHSSESDINRRYGHDFLDAIYDAMNEDGPGGYGFDIDEIHLCPIDLFDVVWENEPTNGFQIAGWYDKGKINIINYKRDKTRYSVILNYENNPQRNEKYLNVNQINPPDDYIVVIDYHPL